MRNEHDIASQYHDIFRYPHLRSKIVGNEKYLETYLNALFKYAEASTITRKIFLAIPLKLILYFFQKNSEILFFAPRFLHLVEHSSYKVTYLSGFSFQNIFNIKKDKSYFPIYLFVSKVTNLYKNDPLLQTDESKKFVTQIVNLFKSTKLKYFVLQNDSGFVERFLIMCAKQANIKTICIQDGVFSDDNIGSLICHGKYADYFLAWSKKQAEIVRKTSQANIKVFGYPYFLKHLKTFNTQPNNYKICILGQPFEMYNHSQGQLKKDIFTKLYLLLRDNFSEIVYKPHPSESNLKYQPSIKRFEGTLDEAFRKFDVFISLTSTALLEATLNQKIAVQLHDETFATQNFEEMGFSYVLDSTAIDEASNFILSLQKPFKNSDIHVYKDIVHEFEKSLQCL